MKHDLKIYTTASIETLEHAIEEAKKCTDDESLQTFLDMTPIVFYRVDDKNKENGLSLEMLLLQLKDKIGRRTVKNTVEVLTQHLNDKRGFKETKQKESVLRRTKGPKYTKEELQLEKVDVELRDELLKINNFDRNLFKNFKLCGNQLVLIDDNDCELLLEDAIGKVSIDNIHWIKPTGLAYRVMNTFMTKIGIYYKQLSEYLAQLDMSELEFDTNNEIIETPIEDFIDQNLPSSFLTFYKIRAIFETWTDNGKKYKSLRGFDLKRNPKIETYNDIFQYVLDNWKKYKMMIDGQSKFIAWSNNAEETSVSHWFPERITKLPKPWEDYINEKMPEKHFQMRLITFLGMCMDDSNTTQQYLIISDKGGTGKGVMMRALESVLPKNSISYIGQSALSDNNEFGLAGIKIWNTHISVMEEYSDKTLCSDKAKELIANNPMNLNVKGKSHVRWEPINHKLIVFSNTPATIKEYANRRRAIPVTYVGQYKWTQEKQDALNSTAKDFLNFCYTVYKENPLFKNNRYIVLSKEEEDEYLKDPSAIEGISDDNLTKRAFNEPLLKEYFNTDEYTDTEDYIDYENFFAEHFEECSDKNKFISAKDMKDYIIEMLVSDQYKEYREAFGFTFVRNGGDIEGNINTRDKAWWKWTQYLNSAHGIKYIRMKKNNKVYLVYPMCKKIDTVLEQKTTDNIDWGL